jgi:DNA mismatch repair protein MutS
MKAKLLKARKESYSKIKEKHPDAVLLFRNGDFYESYNEDAEIVSGICNTYIADDGLKFTAFPFHALDTYLPKIIRHGHRVCIADLDK